MGCKYRLGKHIYILLFTLVFSFYFHILFGKLKDNFHGVNFPVSTSIFSLVMTHIFVCSVR